MPGWCSAARCANDGCARLRNESERDCGSSVLVSRINGRLGNVLFLTPLIDRIHELFPARRSTLHELSAGPEPTAKAPRGTGCHCVSPQGHRMVWRYFAAMRRIRAQTYDVVIDPTPESTSGRIVLTLCRAKYRVGLATDSHGRP